MAPRHWRQVKVGDIAAPLRNALVGGPFGSNLVSSDYVDIGVPVIRGQNMGGRWINSEFVYVTQEKAISLSANLARPQDIIFTQRGTLGQVALVPDKPYVCYLVSQSQMKLTVDISIVEPLFIYYLFKSQKQQEYVKRNAIQTGVPHTNLGILRDTPINLPPLDEQHSIAFILGKLDDKIELIQHMNETFESIAWVLFKSWFTDFDPVHAKAEGRSTGLPKEIDDLFPDSFEDSEIGGIPHGWRVGFLKDEFDLVMGQSPPGETYNEIGEGIPFYQGRTDFTFRFPARRVYCTAPTRFAKKGDTLVSVRAPVGDINMAGEDCAIGRGIASVRHKTGSRSFTYMFMRSLKAIFLQFEAEGTVFGAINKSDFQNISCIFPSKELIQVFERIVTPIDDRIDNSEHQSQSLVILRDMLLQKLISGEIRMSDARRFINEVNQ